MMKMFILSAVLFFVAGAAQAATLNVVGGKLIGASGVDVGGSLYDVQFLGGHCIGLYNGCDQVSDFTFQTSQDSMLASQALEAQVFQSGTFDKKPWKTNGCSASSAGNCLVFTPHGLVASETTAGETLAFLSYFLNTEGGTPDSASSSSILAQRDDFMPGCFSCPGTRTFAVWSTAGSVSAVPIPAAAWLFGSALFALFAISRRRTA